MPAKRHVMHGRDHSTNGADPIPGLGGAVEWEDVGDGGGGSYIDQILAHPALVHYWRMGAPSGSQPDTSGHPGGPVDLLPQIIGTPGTYDVTGALENNEDDGAWQQNAGGASASDHFYTGPTAHRANFVATSHFTIECWGWINPNWTGTTTGYMVSCGSSGSLIWAFGLASNGYRPQLQRGVTGLFASVGLIPGRWYHMAATYDGTTTRIYANGELIYSAANAASIPVTTQPIRVGMQSSSPNNYFWGKIDEVALYTDDLTAAEILAHATAGKPLGFGNSVKYVNAAYQMLATDEIILADGDWASFTVTLPDAAGLVGQRYIVKNRGAAGTITVQRFGSTQTIDGAASVALTGRRAREFVSDGANWQIIGAHL